MMGLSLPHLLIVAVVVLVLFGRGRISEMMGDFGKGIKSFKEGMTDEATTPVPPPPQIAPLTAPQSIVSPMAAPVVPAAVTAAPIVQSGVQPGIIADPMQIDPARNPN